MSSILGKVNHQVRVGIQPRTRHKYVVGWQKGGEVTGQTSGTRAPFVVSPIVAQSHTLHVSCRPWLGMEYPFQAPISNEIAMFVSLWLWMSDNRRVGRQNGHLHLVTNQWASPLTTSAAGLSPSDQGKKVTITPRLQSRMMTCGDWQIPVHEPMHSDSVHHLRPARRIPGWSTGCGLK